MSRSFFRTYGFLSAMLLAIVLGCVLGALWPGATCLAPLGTIFINLMFCIVVPLVFCSLSSSIACMKSPKRAGKIMGTTLLVFIVTGLIAAVIMLFAMRLYPPVLEPWADAAAGAVDEQASVAQLLVNFFTVEDFAALLSRRAMLPLIVFSILIGFGVNLSGGADCLTAKVLQDMTNCLLKVVSLISYYAPVAFFGFFASLVATYGAQITAAYGRAMLVYYPLCFVYALVAFPLYAYLGGGKKGVRVMRRHILRPAVTALGTCSSVATIPTNLEAAEDSGVPRDISDLVLPLGATMHMDGSCFSCVLKIAFLFGVFGIPFEGAGLIVKILLVAVFSSVAMSGIPGGGYIGERDVGKVLKVRGSVSDYRGMPQLTVDKLRLAEDNDRVDVSKLVSVAPIDREAGYDEVKALVSTIEDADYRAVCEEMLRRHEAAFRTIPAAKSVHHSFLSGLLMHTLNMLHLADFLSAQYADTVNRSLLLTGTLLHDFAKEQEFTFSELGLVTDYSTKGQLLGHLVMGAQEVAAIAAELDLPEEKATLLEHLILSHHGQPEFGAAVLPQCAEAELLSLVDQIDSRMEIYREVLAPLKAGEFSQRVFALDNRRVYKHQ